MKSYTQEEIKEIIKRHNWYALAIAIIADKTSDVALRMMGLTECPDLKCRIVNRKAITEK